MSLLRQLTFLGAWSLFGAILTLGLSSAPVFAARDIAGTPTELFFLHPFLNYAPPPLWRQEWERVGPGRSGLRLSVGSVATDEFLTDVELRIDEPLGDGWRLLYQMRWLEALHLDVDEQQHFIGFERDVVGPLALHVLVHPASNKAELDMRAGAMIADASGERYLRVSLRWEDPLFGEKNDVGGEAVESAVGPQWRGRWAWGQWEVYSEGWYLSWVRRRFGDLGLSPEVAERASRAGWSETRVRWGGGSGRPGGSGPVGAALGAGGAFGVGQLLEARLFHQGFAEEERRRDSTVPQVYEDRVVLAAIAYARPLAGRWRACVEAQRLWQDAEIEGSDHRRREVLLGAALGWAATERHTLELGVMASRFDWETRPASSWLGPDEEGWTSKIGFAWELLVGDGGRLRTSLSHEPDPERFGGASLQFQMAF